MKVATRKDISAVLTECEDMMRDGMITDFKVSYSNRNLFLWVKINDTLEEDFKSFSVTPEGMKLDDTPNT